MLSEKNPEFEKAYDTLLDISSDEGERHAAQQHEMYLQNEAAINKEKFELGKIEGIKEGTKALNEGKGVPHELIEENE